MLTSEMGIAEIDFARGQLFPDRLLRRSHARYVALAEQMLQIYRHGMGRARRDLHRLVVNLFQEIDDCPIRRVESFCKLLDDASDFVGDSGGQAATLRGQVFRNAAKHHPLVVKADRLYEHQEVDVKQRIAQELGRPWEWIEGHLFADIFEFHRLAQFRDFETPQALLARYNVAQVQVALFRAVSLTVWTRSDLKEVVRYAKLARLMHSIARAEDGMYRLRFDGPASVLRETRRYGVGMARFLPGLLACRQWRMQAIVERPWNKARLRMDLSSDDGLHSPVPAPDEFDSDLEAKFAQRWGTEPRAGWSIAREADILHQGQKVFVPDFVLTHASGNRVYLEIVGFWTPEYLAAKYETLQTFRDQPILLAVAESAHHQLPPLPSPPLVFKTALRPASVLERLAAAPFTNTSFQS